MNVDQLREKTLAAIDAHGVRRRGPAPAPDTLGAAVFILADHGLPTGEIAIALERSEAYVKVIKSQNKKLLSQRPRTAQATPPHQTEPTSFDPKLKAHFKKIGVLDASGEIDVCALNQILAPLGAAVREIAEPEKPAGPSQAVKDALAFSMAHLK